MEGAVERTLGIKVELPEQCLLWHSQSCSMKYNSCYHRFLPSTIRSRGEHGVEVVSSHNLLLIQSTRPQLRENFTPAVEIVDNARICKLVTKHTKSKVIVCCKATVHPPSGITVNTTNDVLERPPNLWQVIAQEDLAPNSFT